MKKKIVLILWGGLFILCAGLGFIKEAEGFEKFAMMTAAVLFFVPAFVLTEDAGRCGDRRTLILIRNLSILSLAVTAVLLILNFLSVSFSRTAGNVLYHILVIVSAPMICSRFWAGSLFLWACLMLESIRRLKKI